RQTSDDDALCALHAFAPLWTCALALSVASRRKVVVSASGFLRSSARAPADLPDSPGGLSVTSCQIEEVPVAPSPDWGRRWFTKLSLNCPRSGLSQTGLGGRFGGSRKRVRPPPPAPRSQPVARFRDERAERAFPEIVLRLCSIENRVGNPSG